MVQKSNINIQEQSLDSDHDIFTKRKKSLRYSYVIFTGMYTLSLLYSQSYSTLNL